MEEPERPPDAAGSPNRSRFILATTILGSSMAFIDSTAVNVALPVLQSDLGMSVSGAQWVIESYQLLLASLILLCGSLADRFGRRRLFLIGVVAFSAASAWCGLSPTPSQLILARGIQGIGAAILTPGSLAIITAEFDEEHRGAAIGTWAGLTSLTLILGPLMGGWLADAFSWRWVFFINIPIGLIVVLLARRYLPESRDPEVGQIDWSGALLGTMALGGIIFAFIEANRRGFSDGLVIACLLGGTVAAVLFVVVEWRGRSPMLPLTLFRSRDFAGANVLTFLLYAALGGALFFLPFNLIQVQGYSATEAGAANLPMILTLVVLSRWSGKLADRHGARLPLTAGPLIAAAGFALLAWPDTNGSFWTTFFPGLLVIGIGMGLSVAPLTTAVMNSVSQEHAGVASGFNNAVSRTAGLLAVALLGVLVFQVFSARLSDRLRTSDVPAEAIRSVENQAIRLSDISIPNGLDDEDSVALKEAIRKSFVSSFRWAMLVCALMAGGAAISAALTLEGDRSNA